MVGKSFLEVGDKIVSGLGLDDHIIDVSFDVADNLLIEAHLDSPLISHPGVLESEGHGGVAIRTADVFAWKLADMPRVPREKIEHSLNVSPTAKLIKQKLHRFTPDKKETIRVEIKQLLATGFKKEVYHPEWLANPVLVQKKNKE